MNFQITEYCHHILEEYIEEGDICIDATAGNGGDTEFLCQKVGETGNVYAFDVQEMAISHTRERLERANLSTRAKLIHDGHEKMQTYVKEEVKAITFNFGYLPGSDHKIATHPSTSLAAIESALNQKRWHHKPLHLQRRRHRLRRKRSHFELCQRIRLQKMARNRKRLLQPQKRSPTPSIHL